MSQLKKQFAGTLLSNVGITLLNFLTGVITARALNPAGRGATAAIMIWSQTLGWLFALGFAEASSYLQSTAPQNGKKLVGTALLVVIVMGLLGTGFAEWILPAVLHKQDPATLSIARWYFATITLVIAVETLKGILGGDHDFTFLNAVRFGQPALYAGGIVALFAVHKATVSSVLICAAASGLVLALACLVRLSQRLGIGLPSLGILKAGLSYGIRVHPGNFSDIASRRVDLLFMPAFFSATSYGFYSVAANISQMVPMLLGNLCIVVLPAAARVGGAHGLNVVSRSLRIVTITGIILTTLLMICAPILIRVIYGRAYDGAILPLEILLPGGALLAIASIAASGLQSVNRPLDASIAQITGALAVLIGLGIRIHLHHLTIANAAITSTVSYGLTCALALVMLSRATGFSVQEALAARMMMEETTKLGQFALAGFGRISLNPTPSAEQFERNAKPVSVATFFILGLAVAIALFLSNSLPLGGYQIGLLLLVTAPAIFLAIIDSPYLLPYVLLAWVAGPEVRRVFEWSVDFYQAISPLSTIPLIVSATLLIPIIKSSTKLATRLKMAVNLLAIALVYATIVGAIKNGFALVFDAANYIMPLLMVIYASQRQARDSERDLWARSLVTIGIAAAAYGWVQFLVMPDWDAFWMNNEHIDSIGKPIALQVRVFSSLNSSGPAGQFFATAMAAMLVNKRWRWPGLLGWFGVMLVASALALTLVRTAWITIAVFVIVYAMLTGGPSLVKLAIGIAVVVGTLMIALPYLPGGQVISDRVTTLTNLNSDFSYNDRSQFTQYAFSQCAQNPMGTGLGSTGVGTRLDNGGHMGVNGVYDNGFAALLLTFGLPGFIPLWGFLYNLTKYVWEERMLDGSARIAAGIGLASLAGAFAALFSGNCFTGATGVFIWFFVAMAVGVRLPAALPTLRNDRGSSSPRPVRHLARTNA